MGNERYLLFGIESFSAILAEVIPENGGLKKIVEQIQARSISEDKLKQLLGAIAELLFDAMLSAPDVKEHSLKQLNRVADKAFILTSDYHSPWKIKINPNKPHISIDAPKEDDFDALPVVTITPEFLRRYAEGDRILMNAVLDGRIKIDKTLDFDIAYTRLILTLSAVFHTKKKAKEALVEGIRPFLNSF
ncbi:MAG: hypothetical protein ACTSRW_14830 [Candidatus Helarchaeota archaeon]